MAIFALCPRFHLYCMLYIVDYSMYGWLVITVQYNVRYALVRTLAFQLFYLAPLPRPHLP